MLPDDWIHILNAPTFIISMAERRYNVCLRRAKNASFSNISHMPGIDRNSQEAIHDNWKKHTFLPKNQPYGDHAAAVMLAHLNVWKHIIENNIEYAVIFEDDMLFHTEWDNLAEKYYTSTPKTADMIFMGHHCGNAYPNMHIAQIPVYCLNAYIITLDGAKKMYHMITQYPIDDFGVIDMMIANIQTSIITLKNNPFAYSWYAWNTEMFPDPENDAYKHKDALHKDKGLVFQQNPYFEFDHEKDAV